MEIMTYVVFVDTIESCEIVGGPHVVVAWVLEGLVVKPLGHVPRSPVQIEIVNKALSTRSPEIIPHLFELLPNALTHAILLS